MRLDHQAQRVGWRRADDRYHRHCDDLRSDAAMTLWQHFLLGLAFGGTITLLICIAMVL